MVNSLLRRRSTCRITSRTSRIATVDVGGGRILLFGLDDIRQPPRNSKTEGNRGRSLQLFWATQQSGAFIRCHLRHFNRLCSRTKISRTCVPRHSRRTTFVLPATGSENPPTRDLESRRSVLKSETRRM